VFDDQPHRSLATSELLAARTVVVSSFGKTFHTTGWKVGYALAPRQISAEIRKVHQFMVFAVNTPAQHAFARYLQDPAPYFGLRHFYQAKRDRFRAGLARTRFKLLPCEGTYFVLADYSAVSDLPEAEFAQQMIVDYGVAVIPVSVFYRQPFENRVVRFCFAKKDETLDEALRRLDRLR
jgi:methionine aminotransferase